MRAGARMTAGVAAGCAILGLIAEVHGRLLGIRAPLYLASAAALLLCAMSALMAGDGER